MKHSLDLYGTVLSCMQQLINFNGHRMKCIRRNNISYWLCSIINEVYVMALDSDYTAVKANVYEICSIRPSVLFRKTFVVQQVRRLVCGLRRQYSPHSTYEMSPTSHWMHFPLVL